MNEDNVAGVRLPVFSEVKHAPTEKKNSYGLSGGGQMILKSQEKWKQLLGFLIKLASLQVIFIISNPLCYHAIKLVRINPPTYHEHPTDLFRCSR